MQLPAARRLYARTPSLWIVGQTGTVVAVLTDNPATRKMLRETTSRQCSGGSSAPLVVGRTAPQSPAARPTAAPPRPMSCCERFISWCTLVPPSRVGRVGAGGREEPAAGVSATQRRGGEQPADQCIAVAHRPQQQLRRGSSARPGRPRTGSHAVGRREMRHPRQVGRCPRRAQNGRWPCPAA